MKFMRGAKGSISIFLILIMAPMLTSVYTAISAIRLSAAKTNLSSAMALAGNAALNSYSEVLMENYGIFAMELSVDEMDMVIKNCMSLTLEGPDGSERDNFINAMLKTADADYSTSAGLANTDVFEAAVTDYMKYRAPYTFTVELAGRVNLLTNFKKITEVLEKSESYYSSLDSLSKKLKKISKKLPSADDAESTAETIDILLKNISAIKDAAETAESSASEWKASIDELESDDIKGILQTTFNSTAGIFTDENIDRFKEVLEEDKQKLESGDTNVQFTSESLYQYIKGTGSKSEDNSGGNTASELNQIADTDVKSLADADSGLRMSDLLSSAMSDSIESLTGQPSETSGDSILSFGSGKADKLIKNCYIEEFATQMFSMQTTAGDAKAPSGVTFSSKPLFGAEAEYILFGNDKLRYNVETALSLIFAVRLALNSLYAFSNAKMRAEALSAATALAGWTGVGVGLAQNLILTAWAGAESVLDVSTLSKGGSVPFYKTASTWTLSLSGVTQTLASGAENYAAKQIDNIYEEILNTAESGINELQSLAEEYISETASGAAETLTNEIITPIEAEITALVSSKTAGISGKSREDIETTLIKAIDGNVKSDSKGAALAKQLFYDYCFDSVVDSVFANYEYLFAEDDTLTNLAYSEIEKKLDSAYSKLFSLVQNELNKISSSAKEELANALGKSSESAKSIVIEKIDSFSGTVSEYLGTDSDTQTSVAAAAGTAMSYKDYIRLFMLIALSTDSGKQSLITRMNKVMQVNCASESSDFNITKCYRAVQIDSVAEIGGRSLKASEIYEY